MTRHFSNRLTFLLAFLALLPLGACAGNPRPAEDAWLAKIYESSGNLDTEASALPGAGGRAARRGDDLVLTLAGGKTLTLHGEVKGCADGDAHCDGFRLVADLADRHFYLVNEFYYEGGDYWLIDDRSGRKTRIDSIPQFSPDNHYFLIQDDDEASDHENDLEIWRREGDGAVREWGAELKESDTGVSHMFGPPHSSLVVWTGERITLRFSTGRHLDRGVLVAQRQWTGTLARTPQGWRLDALAPKPLRDF